MFFYRHGVSEPHLNRYAYHLHKLYLERKVDRIFTLGAGFDVCRFYEPLPKEWVYFIIEVKEALENSAKLSRAINPAVWGFVSLSKIPRWKALETSMLYVSPGARGMGIASNIYRCVLMDGVLLMSGYSHNPKSRRLWMKMVQDPDYVVWAHDIINLDRYADVVVEDGDFNCELKIYEDIKKIRRLRKQDIRFIAYHPQYINRKMKDAITSK